MARTLGLAFNRCAPGEVELEIPVLEAFTFRSDQLQATSVFAIADFAAVAAAGTLLAPAEGRVLRARGRVTDAGKLLTVCAADVYAVADTGEETLCATLLGTARNIDMNRSLNEARVSAIKLGVLRPYSARAIGLFLISA